MTRSILPLALLACGPSTPTPLTVGPLGDVTLTRNTDTPATAQHWVEVGADAGPFEIALSSDAPDLLPDQTTRCDASPCELRLAPVPDRTADIAVRVTVTAHGETASQSFTVRLRPRLVTELDDDEDAPGSLRATLSASEPGDVIGFDLTDADTLTLREPLTVPHRVTLEGPGAASLRLAGAGSSRLFDVLEGGDLSLRDLSLADGLAADGGAIRVHRGRLHAERVRFANHRSQDGGAIFALEAQVELTEVVFEDNHAEDQGGALWLGNSMTHLDHVHLGGEGHPNRAETTGGAIMQWGGELHADHTVFSHNASKHAMAMEAWPDDTLEPVVRISNGLFQQHKGGAWAVFIHGDAAFDDTDFTHNETDSNALSVMGSSTRLERVTVTENRMQLGSAFASHAFATTILDSTFAHNRKDQPNVPGGGLSLFGHAEVRGTTLLDNTCPAGGSGLYVGQDADVTWVGGQIADNRSGESSYGAGVYVHGRLDMANGTITGNRATDGSTRGGALYNAIGGTLVIRDTAIGAPGEPNRATWGAGLFNDGTVDLQPGVLVAHNEAELQGGGLFFGSPRTGEALATMGGVTVRGNSAGTRGGGVYIGDKTRITVAGTSVIEGNSVPLYADGAGVFISRLPPKDVVTAFCIDLADRILLNMADDGELSNLMPFTYCP